MKNIYKYVIILLLLLGAFNTSWCGKIVYPWRAATALVKSGETFEVWFSAVSYETIDSVTLKGPYNTVQVPFSIQNGYWVYDKLSGNSYNMKIIVSIPSDTPEERYDLILNTSFGQEKSERSVKVVREYKSSHYVLHHSDNHMLADGMVNGHPKNLPPLSAIVDVANIIGVDLVFATGDNQGYDYDSHHLNHPKDGFELWYEGYKPAGLKGTLDFNGATFDTPGNHDFSRIDIGLQFSGYGREKSLWWNEYAGLVFQTVKYGEARYMTWNNGWIDISERIDGKSYYEYQLEEHSQWLDSVGSGNFRSLAYHDFGSSVANSFIVNENINITMNGHWHVNDIENPNTHPTGRNIGYFARGMMGNSQPWFNLYKIDSDGKFTWIIENNVISSLNAVENPDDHFSQWRPKIKLTYANDNDGTHLYNVATLVNKFNISFPNARVRFVMPKGNSFAVSPGIVEQEFEGDKFHIVDVSIPINKRSTTQIEIFATASHEHNLIAFKQTTNLDKVPILSQNISPELEIWNLGSSVEYNVPVHCKINLDGKIYFSNTQYIDEINPNESCTVKFENWNPQEEGKYNITFYSQLSTDQDKASDTLKSSINVSNLLDDFENDLGNWTTKDSWGVDKRRVYTGEYSMVINPDNRYENNLDSYAMYNYSFDLTSVEDMNLTFWSQTIMASGDSGFVEISVDKGSTWERLGDPFTGLESEWKQSNFSLQKFSGNSNVRFRFHFVSDENKNHLGWFIDDIKFENIITRIDEFEASMIPGEFKLFNNYPNPFNPSTTIRFSIPKKEFVKLKVYDVLGEEVAVLVNKEMSVGSHSVIFNAVNLTSGIYLYKLSVGDFAQVNKMLLLK